MLISYYMAATFSSVRLFITFWFNKINFVFCLPLNSSELDVFGLTYNFVFFSQDGTLMLKYFIVHVHYCIHLLYRSGVIVFFVTAVVCAISAVLLFFVIKRFCWLKLSRVLKLLALSNVLNFLFIYTIGLCYILEFLEKNYFIVHARFNPMHIITKREDGQLVLDTTVSKNPDEHPTFNFYIRDLRSKTNTYRNLFLYFIFEFFINYIIIVEERILGLCIETLLKTYIYYINNEVINMDETGVASVKFVSWRFLKLIIKRCWIRFLDVCFNIYFYSKTLKENNFSLTTQHSRRVAVATTYLQLRYATYGTTLIHIDYQYFKFNKKHLFNIGLFYNEDYTSNVKEF